MKCDHSQQNLESVTRPLQHQPFLWLDQPQYLQHPAPGPGRPGAQPGESWDPQWDHGINMGYLLDSNEIIVQWIGLREILQENTMILMGKLMVSG